MDRSSIRLGWKTLDLDEIFDTVDFLAFWKQILSLGYICISVDKVISESYVVSKMYFYIQVRAYKVGLCAVD